MEEKEWSKIINDHFDKVDFCFVEEIWPSQAFGDVYKVRVTFEFWSSHNFTEGQKQEKVQELIPLCNRLIEGYPKCMFAFRYLKQNNEAVVFLESPMIPEPVRPIKSVEYYRELLRFASGSLQSRTYDVSMGKLIELTLCPADQIKTILDHEGLSPNSLTYFDLQHLVLDYRVVVRNFKKGQPICVPFSELPDSFDGAIRLIDKVVFSALYSTVKCKSAYRCFCCEAAGEAIHHINGDHYDMVEENLAFLCNDCHYYLHREWLQSRGVQSGHWDMHHLVFR